MSIAGAHSHKQDLPFGMPQGSLFGPFSYPKYAAPISRIAEKYGIHYHQYADDTQLYVECTDSNVDRQRAKLEQCIEEIREWSTSNKLRLNDSKTEFLVVGSRYAKKKPDIDSLSVGEENVPAVTSARNIGVQMDCHLTLESHVNNVCKASYAQLRGIALIRKHLTQDAAATLVNSLITSRLDSMNSLLIGLPDILISKLQRIQNHAAKVVAKKNKHDHVTPILQALHWLPVESRIEYKVLLITHKCLQGKAPEYLSSRLHKYKPGRSGDMHLLVQPRSSQKSYGDRAFSVMAPRLWNKLPLGLRMCDSLDTFKKDLKTFLFRRCFGV